LFVAMMLPMIPRVLLSKRCGQKNWIIHWADETVGIVKLINNMSQLVFGMSFMSVLLLVISRSVYERVSLVLIVVDW
jgi:hypothetical protein